jgi:hypothetical protein
MRGLLVLTLLSLGAACDRLDGDGIVLQTPCDAQIPHQLHPQGGASSAYPGAIVWADLACPDPGATLSLTRGGGDIPGAVLVTHGNRQIRFLPDAPMLPQASYVARLDTGDGFVDWEFVTSNLGGPVGSGLAERALALFPGQGGVLEPAGHHDELRRLLREAAHPVVQFQGEPSGGGVAMRVGARLEEDASAPQDPGVPTQDVIAAWQEPVWSLGPLDLVLPGDGWSLTLQDATLRGAVGPGVASGGGGSIAALWDVRSAEGGLSPAFDAPCEVDLAAGGQGCVPCRDGATACLPFDLRDSPALAWGGLLQGR